MPGTVYPLRNPLYFKGYEKESKTNVATRGGLIAIKSNTGMSGSIIMKAIVLPATQQQLFSMSQLDDNGCYMTMGGGKLRVRRRRDRSDFLELPRPTPREGMMLLHAPPPPENKVAGGTPEGEINSLYYIPLDLFRRQGIPGDQVFPANPMGDTPTTATADQLPNKRSDASFSANPRPNRSGE